jgi:RNA polymerase sigma-70 factor (ECF subfamily)
MAAAWMCSVALASAGVRDCIRRAKAGDIAAFEEIVAMHERLVLRTAQRLLDNSEDAKDAAQDVFVKLHGNLSQFREENELIPWLYRITVNRCLDMKRRAGNVSRLNETDFIAAGPDPEQTANSVQRQSILRAALKELPDRERAAIVLRDLEGRSTAEVAKILRSSQSTVRSQISMGRRRIREFLGKRGEIR